MKIDSLIRENIRRLKPYSSARHEFGGQAEIFLDANESPFDSGYNRYPDPLQQHLKSKISAIKNVDPTSIFLGNGSDEAIDLLIRIFCQPREDEIIIVPPTYGMYKVCADISEVTIRSVLLRSDFQLDVESILRESSKSSKMLFICSPNNPTGNLMDSDDVERLLRSFPGIIVIDEAYVDFCPAASWVRYLSDYPNLVILQTLSKAWGLAAIRLGIALAAPEIIYWMNAVKPPYNINVLTQNQALKVLENEQEMHEQVAQIIAERRRVKAQLTRLPFVLEVMPSDANFLLVRVDHPRAIFEELIKRSIVVRDRSTQPLCEGCLRITIGSVEENNRLVDALKQFE